METNFELTEEIVRRIADLEGLDPADLPEPLYYTINTTALERLFTNGNARVTFEYLDYEVTVDQDGRIDIANRSD